MRTWLVQTDCLGLCNAPTTGGIVLDGEDQEDVRRYVKEHYPRHYRIRGIRALSGRFTPGHRHR